MERSSETRRRDARLLLELGRGGMGVVYLALAQGPGGFAKLKVIKRLLPDLASEPRAVQMFLEEARIAARLHHPNIVQTNEVGYDGKHYFLEMEYLEGRSYDALVAPRDDGRALPMELHVYVLAQALAGLDHAHRLTDLDGSPLGLVHRDVSPHNVFVTYDGQVKLLDFGIAKAAGSSRDTTTGGAKGKAKYMAPEQAARKHVDRRADIFAVGVMLWQAITGQRLWGDLGDFDIFLKLRSEEIPPPRSVRPGAPQELERICVKALARDPDARWATAGEMQAALEAYLESTGAHVGQKQLARYMAERFASTRACVQAEIEARIKRGASDDDALHVLTLGDLSTGLSTGSQAGTSNSVREAGARGATTKPRRGERRVSPRALAAIGAAAVAVVGAAFALGPRIGGRDPRATGSKVAAPGSSAPALRECDTSAQCVAARGGAPWICRKSDGKCAALESEDCKVLADPGDVANDRTVWFGTMFPLTGPKAAAGSRDTNAIDLGRRDFMQVARGLSDPGAKEPARPIGIVACDDAVHAERAARHLVSDLGIHAVIGFGSSQEIIDLANSLFVPTRTVAVATENMSPLVTAVPQPIGEPRLVWRTALSSSQYLVPVSLVVPTIVEPALRSRGVVHAHAPLRVALLRPGTVAGMSAADILFERLRFNGKSALENGENFRQFVFGDIERDAPKLVEEMLAFSPHAIIFDGSSEIVAPFFRPLEARWPTPTFRPYYISQGSIHGDETFAWIGKDADLRHRVFGVAPPAKTPQNAKLTMRYNELYSPKITGDLSPGAPYDAIYLLAYAAYLASEPTGPKLSRAISRLIPPGKPIEVGPTRILDAMDVLRTGANIDLVGTMSRLDFDPATGESIGDLVVLCVGIDASGRAVNGIESGVFYDSATGTLRGAFSCQ